MIQWIVSIILILDVCTNSYDKKAGEGGGACTGQHISH